MIYDWEGATFTINGKPFAAESISYRERATNLREVFAPVLHEVSATMTVTRFAMEDLLRALGPLFPPGATVDTLWRRVGYGGRKGRSALRRLRSMGVLSGP